MSIFIDWKFLSNQGDLGGPLVCKIDEKDTLIGILDAINEKTEKFAAVSSVYVEVAKIIPWISSIIGSERELDGQPWKERSNGLISNPDFFIILIFISLHNIFWFLFWTIFIQKK